MTSELETQINILKAELQKFGFTNLEDAVKYLESIDIQKLKEELMMLESIMKDLPSITNIMTDKDDREGVARSWSHKHRRVHPTNKRC